MNLKEIRDTFSDVTGRLDLKTNTSLGNFYINAGLRFLDDKVKAPTAPNRHIVPLAIGISIVYIKGLRSINSVYYRLTSDYGITILERIEEETLIDRYGLQVPTFDDSLLPYDSRVVTETGSPKFYSLIPIAPSPEQISIYKANNETNPAMSGMKYGLEDDTIGFLVYPAPEAEGTLIVNGYFDRGHLYGDTETNWWTSTYPDLVVEAASYKLEISQRNSEGIKDKLTPLLAALQDVERQIIDLEIGAVNEMEA